MRIVIFILNKGIMKQYIYLFTFPNGKYYVGRTDDFSRRLAEHKIAAKKKKRHQLYWAIRKYGWDSIKKEIIAESNSVEDIIALEYDNIVKYDSIRNGYNMTENTQIGGDNWEGRRDSEEYREFLDHMRIIRSGEGNGMYGKTHREDSKVLLKEKAKGRYSLPWYIERHGEEEGTKKYNERCYKLKNRVIDWRDPVTGDFVKRKK
jgi:group I intron endonuclease